MMTAFIDGQARLMIARRVVDSLHPGLAQLGVVWPPIPQIFMLPFIWNGFLYSSGIAGAVVSMASYVVAVVFLYKLVVSVSEDRTAGLIGAIAFSSPNILYMQSVPMSEMSFIAFFVMSVYFLMRWVQDVEKLQLLFFTALSVLLATLTRYEGWVLFCAVAVVIVYTCWRNHFSYAKTEGYFVFFATLALFGISLWFIWGQLIFGDFLYFFSRGFSANAQLQSMLEQIPPSQKTGGNLLFSLLVYGRTTLDNVGWITTALGCAGIIYLFFARRPSEQKLVALTLLFPFVFYVLSLFAETHVIIQHPAIMDGSYANLRLGVLMLPAAGFFTGFLSYKKRNLVKAVIVLLIIISAMVT